ncbi:MAG TPA: hypothetical protein GX503_05180 [Clostridiales bacterium]|nr:hypothetical protein [Clostridiales bacterium]
MVGQFSICMPEDLGNLKNVLERKGYHVNTDLKVRDDTLVYIFSDIDEEWEGIGAIQEICFAENQCVLTLNASRLTEEEMVSLIDEIAQKRAIKKEIPKKIKVSLEEGLDELKEVLQQNGYEVVPAYKVDKDVSVMIFSGWNEHWQEIGSYPMMQYGESDSILTMNALDMTPEEILQILNRVYGKNKSERVAN